MFGPDSEEDQKIKELRALPYDQYLQSDHWRKMRRRVLRRVKYKCQLCDDKPSDYGEGMHVHHSHYRSLGCEDPIRDLVALCPTCHRRHHEITSLEASKTRYDKSKKPKIKSNKKPKPTYDRAVNFGGCVYCGKFFGCSGECVNSQPKQE